MRILATAGRCSEPVWGRAPTLQLIVSSRLLDLSLVRGRTGYLRQ